MNDSTTSFSGAVPSSYHAGLGPLLLEPYAAELAKRVPKETGLRILETACGTGIATRHVLEAVPTAEIAATDLNADMLVVARGHLGDHHERVTFLVRITHETILEFFPDDPPRFYETPFSLDDPRALGALLQGEGFHDVRVEVVEQEGHAIDARAAARALLEGNPVADAIRARRPESLPLLRDEVERRLADAFGPTDLRVPLTAIIATATA